MSLPLLWAAPAFSLGITVGGIEVPHFNNVQIAYSADGVGAKGVMCQQLTFNVPACEYGDTSGLFPYRAEVAVSCSLELPKFYVYSRKPNGVNLSFTCCDRSMFASEISSITDDSLYTVLSSEPSDWAQSYKKYFTKSANGYSSVTGSSAPTFTSGKYYSLENNGYIPTSTVIDDLTHICGFKYISTGDIIGSAITEIHKDNVIGKSAKEILSGLAEAACGCFFVQTDGSLAFLPFASGSFSGQFAVEKHEKICYGLSKSCDSVFISDGSRAYSSGSVSDVYHTVKIDTVYASQALAGAVINSLKGKEYTAWKCGNSLVNFYPAPGSGIEFEGKLLVCNFCRLKLTSAGFFASMGRNDVSESEYSSEYARSLSERVKIGEINGNTKITRDGVKFVFINENSKSSGGIEEYGFNAMAGGITEFTGSILNSIQPTGKFVTDTEGNECFRANYNGKQYDYGYSEDSEGNITLFKNEVTDSG